MNHDFFYKNYKEILELANTEAGRYFLADKEKEPIIRVRPNSYTRLVGWRNKKPSLKTVFFTHDRVEQKICGPLEQMAYIAGRAETRILKRIIENHYEAFLHFADLDIKPSRYPMAYLTTTVYNPASGGEQEARVENAGTWAGARDAATSGGNHDADFTIGSSDFSGPAFYNYRGFTPYASGVDLNGAAVTSWTNEVYRDNTIEHGGNGFNNADTTSLEIVVSTQASTTAYVAGDYDNITFTSKGTLAFASTTNAVYNLIGSTTDNTVPKTDGTDTKLCLITGRDLSNTAPTGLNLLPLQDRNRANPIKFTVVYTGGGGGATGPTSYKSLLGVGQG